MVESVGTKERAVWRFRSLPCLLPLLATSPMDTAELPALEVDPAPEPRVFASLRAAGDNFLAPPEVVPKAITDDDVDGYKEQEVRSLVNPGVFTS